MGVHGRIVLYLAPEEALMETLLKEAKSILTPQKTDFWLPGPTRSRIRSPPIWGAASARPPAACTAMPSFSPVGPSGVRLLDGAGLWRSKRTRPGCWSKRWRR